MVFGFTGCASIAANSSRAAEKPGSCLLTANNKARADTLLAASDRVEWDHAVAWVRSRKITPRQDSSHAVCGECLLKPRVRDY